MFHLGCRKTKKNHLLLQRLANLAAKKATYSPLNLSTKLESPSPNAHIILGQVGIVIWTYQLGKGKYNFQKGYQPANSC